MKFNATFIFALALIATMFTSSLSSLSLLHATDHGKLIFEDDFNRNETDETKEAIGNGWDSNSKSRAGGNKQVDLRDGTMHIFMHKTADHAVSVKHDAAFTNGTVVCRFMLEDKKDTLGLKFADMQLKTVHAGHLFKVTIGVKKLEIADLKTGVMDLKIRTARKAGEKLSPETQKMLATKKKSFPAKLEAGQWYNLVVKVAGDKIVVAIDGKEAGAFASEGFAHPTKRMLRLSVPREAVVDDLKIYSAK